MTEQEREVLKRVLAEQTAKHMASKEEARAFLIKTGTYTEDGELTPGCVWWSGGADHPKAN